MIGKNSILKIDKFATRGTLQKMLAQKDYSFVVVLITILAMVFDFNNVFNRYDLITKAGDITMLLATTAASVLILDVPMSIAGTAAKKRVQEMISSREAKLIIFGSVFAFAAIAILNLWLSIECAEFMLEDPAVSSNTNIFSETKSTNSVMAGALILGTQPILTSIPTFVVGFYFSNPRLSEVNRLKKVLNRYYAHQLKGQQALAEVAMYDPELYNSAKKFRAIKKMFSDPDFESKEKQQLVKEKLDDFVQMADAAYFKSSAHKEGVERCRAATQMVYAQECLREQATLFALQKMMNTPDEISRISKFSKDLAEQYATGKMYEQEKI